MASAVEQEAAAGAVSFACYKPYQFSRILFSVDSLKMRIRIQISTQHRKSDQTCFVGFTENRQSRLKTDTKFNSELINQKK
jgi:hypothetical protein